MRILRTLLCLLPAVVQGAQDAAAPVVVDESLFTDDDFAEVVVLPEETADAPAAEPAPQPITPQVPQTEPAVTPPVVAAEVPAVAPKEMTPEELAALEQQKPAPSPDALEPPEGMALIETYLPPTYSNLAKRTPTGDWVTCHFKQPLVPREQTQVAVLGYHDFSNTKSTTEMRMKTAEFCRQMQFIKDSNICVISMQDFLEWRFGTRCLPARCVLITIDDGWKSVYTDAYPVLKAYGYPFTLFVYVRYIGVQGASMTQEQIKEMMQHGATIGSHSWNHLYPSKWKRYKQSSVQYATQLQKEFIDSRAKLQEWFTNCSTYCYPGGYHTAPMRSTLKIADYKAAFTVIEKKVKCDVKPYQINRYMVFGVDTSIFRRAVNFDGQAGVDPTITAINNAEAPARLFFPTAFTDVASPLVQTEKTAAEKAAAKAAETKAAEETAAAAEQAMPTAEAPATEPAPAAEQAPANTPEPQPITESPQTAPTEPQADAASSTPATTPTQPTNKKKGKGKKRSSKKK